MIFALAISAIALSLMLTRATRNTGASSHREAPLIVADPLADNTDTYAFRSTEAGRSGFVTLDGELDSLPGTFWWTTFLQV